MDIPQELLAWRKENGLSRRKAAKCLGIPERTYESYEYGVRTPQRLALETFRQRFGKLQKSVFTCYKGTNADLVVAAASLYIRPGQRVCDPTYGKGTFWARVDTSQFELVGSDRASNKPLDFAALPYPAKSFEHFVFDPPYMHHGGRVKLDPRAYAMRAKYGNSDGVCKSHQDIIADYAAGIREAARVLKRHGLLWVKCQDEIQNHRQCWSHVEIYELARAQGFTGHDLFVLHQHGEPVVQFKRQTHARKNHSFLWIFRRR